MIFTYGRRWHRHALCYVVQLMFATSHDSRGHGRYRRPAVRRVSRVSMKGAEHELVQAFESAGTVMRKHLVESLRTDSRAAFMAYWEKHWEQFLSAFEFFQSIASTLLARSAELRETADETYESAVDGVPQKLGEDVAAELHFAAETVERAQRIANRIEAAQLRGAEPADEQRDGELAVQFGSSMALHSLAFNCIAEIVEGRAHPAAEVQETVLELLRVGALDAYDAAAQGLALRVKPERLDGSAVAFEDEHEQLADEHLDDVARLIRDTGHA